MISLAETVGDIVAAFITTLAEGPDVQPLKLATVKVYVVFGDKPEIVVDCPDPVFVPPFQFKVQVPVVGNPLNTTEPVGTEQFGWVIVPTDGAVGRAGAALINTLFEAL